MNEKEIVDYIVVHHQETEIEFMERINVKIQEFKKDIESLEWQIDKTVKPITFLSTLKEEFEKLKSLKEGDSYAYDTAYSIENWMGGTSYLHPLRDRGLSYNYGDDKVTQKQIWELNKTYNSITQKLDGLLEDKKANEQKLKVVKSDLEALVKNQDPISNKDIRTAFEKDVLALLNKGYVLQGGVTSSRGYINQAMVKYTE